MADLFDGILPPVQSPAAPKPGRPDFCRHCRQRIRKPNQHRVCRQKVQVLELLAKARIDGHPWVKLEEGDIAVVNGITTPTVYLCRVHANRLVWFGLVEHGPARSGKYRATDKGLLFLQGRAAVPAVIYCKDGKVVESDRQLVTIADVRHVVLDKQYWDTYAAGGGK